MHVALVLLLGVAAVSALPTLEQSNRIAGGTVTTIDQWPYAVALLASSNGVSFSQACAGTIINNRSVLTAAHCFITLPSAWQWRSRVGSTWASSGGTVFNTNQIINHPWFNRVNYDVDVAIIRISGAFSFNNNVRAATIAGPNYLVGNNQPVWTVGWGAVCYGCPSSEQLRQVQVWTVDLHECRRRYDGLRIFVTSNMMCAGWLEVGGRDACDGDGGGPLVHNNNIVGITSWGHQCATATYPGVYARVNVVSNWVTSNA